jgi:hypothetical protein
LDDEERKTLDAIRQLFTRHSQKAG